MKKALILVSTILVISFSYAADTYWENWCTTENILLGNYLTKAEAVKWGNKHVLDTGHTVTTKERERGK